jgi:pyruvate dehydrogenase E1 component alpha subunit
LIEAQTYRLEGHWAEDAANYRSADELARWQPRDPLTVTRAKLLAAGTSVSALDAIEDDARRQVELAFARVRELPDAGRAELGLDEVYAT